MLLLFFFPLYSKKGLLAGVLFHCFLHTIHQPEVDIGRNDGGEGKGDADFEEIGVLDLVTFTTENANARDVGRGADGGAVATEGGTRQKPEVEDGRIDAESVRKSCDDGNHRGNIGDVVNKGGDKNGCPDNNGVKHQDVSATRFGKQRCCRINHALLFDATNHKEEAEQKTNRLKIDGLKRGKNGIGRFLANEVIDKTDRKKSTTDQTICDIGFVRDKGGHNEQNNSTHKQNGGDIVGDHGFT